MGDEQNLAPEPGATSQRSLESPARESRGKRDGGTREKRTVMSLDVSGEAEIRNERKYRASIAEFIPELNSNAKAISEELRADIKSVLPPDVEVEVSVSFHPGSVDLAALVTIISAAGTVLEVISLSKQVVSAAKVSVQKILGKRVGSKYPVRKITSRASPVKFTDPVHRFTRFLWWCSGSYMEILRASPTEAVKYEGLGGAVLTTGVLACLTGGYALYTMFEWSYTAFIAGPIFGLLWGLIIFNLDRYIVSTLKKLDWERPSQRLLHGYGPALVRLALAVFIGVTIAKPLELALFHSEVASRIEFNKDREVKARGDELDALNENRVRELTGELARQRGEDEDRRQRVEFLRQSFASEMDGTGGSRRYGRSVVAIEKERLYENSRKEYEDWLRASTQERLKPQNELDDIRKRRGEVLSDYARTLEVGFLRRLKALSDLTQAEWSVWLANIFIVGLLVLIEALPVLVKLIAPFGPYDAKLNLKEEADISKAKARKESLVEITKRHYENLTQAEKKVDEAFFNESVGVRIGKIGEGHANWVNAAFDGKGEPFEDFLSSTEENIFLNRKP